MKITEMTIIEMIKHSCIRLIGLVLIAIPLMMCYPILFLLGFSERVSTITTAILSVFAYVLLIRYFEPILRRTLALRLIPLIFLVIVLVLRFLPFSPPKVQDNLEKERLRRIEYRKVIS